VESIPLAGHIADLRDPTGNWTLDDVLAPERAAQFTTVERATINHGLSAGTWWYRMVLRIPEGLQNRNWMLSIGIPTLDYAHWRGMARF
jgi:hypothetical protein